MTNTTIYRITGSNTRPLGLGFEPSYSIEQPVFSQAQLWEDRLLEAEPVAVTLPDGYTICESAGAGLQLYDPQSKHVEIVDDHGHPAIYIGAWVNKQGKPYPRYQRLDK